MNIYKAPNLIISPKHNVKGGGGINDGSIYTHTYSPSFSLSLTHIHTNTHLSITVSGPEGYWARTRCIFRADLKADVELGWWSEIGREFHGTEAWDENLCCQKDFRRNEGMWRRRESDVEWSCREEMENFRRSDRYDRPFLFTDLKERWGSLYSILCSTESHWRVWRMGERAGVFPVTWGGSKTWPHCWCGLSYPDLHQ